MGSVVCALCGAVSSSAWRECGGLPETRGCSGCFAGFRAAWGPPSAVSLLGDLDRLILLELRLCWRISG